jgi:REP element-mobilizing transposase RayT
MTDPPWEPNSDDRRLILQTISEVCRYRGWVLFAANVRLTHIHAVVEADGKPEKVLHDFKSYSTRALDRDGSVHKMWSRHGSTVYLWTNEEVSSAVKYVAEGEGQPTSLTV